MIDADGFLWEARGVKRSMSIPHAGEFSGLVNRAASLLRSGVDVRSVAAAVRVEVGDDRAFLVFAAAQLKADPLVLSGGGKTTLTAQLIRRTEEAGGIPMVVDTESLTGDWAKDILGK